MATERKIAQVAELTELIKGSEIAISTDLRGVSVAEQTRLRHHFTEAGVGLKVVKNTLLRRAAGEAGREVFAELADGSTALVTHPDDPVAAAKAAVEYRRDNADTRFLVRSAVVNDMLVDAAYIEDLATVPPREQLVARIAGGLTGKIVELAMLLQASTQELAGLLDARAKQLEESEAGS